MFCSVRCFRFLTAAYFIGFEGLVVKVKIKSEKSKAPTSPRVSPAPRIMKNYTANAVGYISFEWLSAKSVQIVGQGRSQGVEGSGVQTPHWFGNVCAL